ncbi:MAG TPA: SDR family oxidoreductase [Parafilimonas sp.]|nr:SDR family oxidoreductase [Parafilimonas sp.]
MNVIITGASKGLGKAIAEKFAEAGHHLIICARNESLLSVTKDELLKKNPACKIEFMATDLSKKENAIAFANFALQFGTPDILINNAGSFVPGSIHSEAEGALEEMMETNLYSAYHLTRKLLPKMMEAKSGHIFNMCSIASIQAYPNGGSYSLSKWALLGLTKNLRVELMQFKIKVTAVIPGAVYTDSWAESNLPPERFMQPDDIASMIYAASMLSPQACVEEILMRPQLGDL